MVLWLVDSNLQPSDNKAASLTARLLSAPINVYIKKAGRFFNFMVGKKTTSELIDYKTCHFTCVSTVHELTRAVVLINI